MKIEKQEPTLGAVICELNLSTLTSAEWDEIYQQFLEHAVLIFPEQYLSKKEQEGFAARFGEIEHLTEGAKTTAITNKTPKGVSMMRTQNGLNYSKVTKAGTPIALI